MRPPSTSGLSVELLLRVIDVKYGYFTLLFFWVHLYWGELVEACDMYDVTKAARINLESEPFRIW